MKVEKNNNGWNEIVTKKIVIKRIFFNFMDRDWWLGFNKANPKIGRKRNNCQCCKKPFSTLSGNIALAITNGLNKPICEACANEFKEKGIEITTRLVN